MNEGLPPRPKMIDPRVDAPLGVEVRNQAIALYNESGRIVQTDQNTAYNLLSSSVDVDPSFWQGWLKLGRACADMNLLPSALACFRRVVELKPDLGEAWVDLGWRLFGLGRVKEARKALDKAIEIDPKLSYAWINLSLIESIEGNMKKAVHLARKAYELDPEPAIETGLALNLMMAGHYAEGLKRFRARYAYKLAPMLSYPNPMWLGDDLSDKTLFIQSEQGLGDALSMVRFIPAVAQKAKSIIFGVQPELLRLLHDMLMHWPNIVVVPLPTHYPMCDFWTTPLDLPVALGLTDEQIASAPNLPMPEYRNPTPWKVQHRKLHVGICWQGSTLQDLDKFRSMPFTNFLELARVPNVQLYSLQLGDHASQLDNARAHAVCRNLAPYIRDVADTVAILNELDLVVTVETALGHIAGAAGTECWTLVSTCGGDWRCGRAAETPLWYKKHRLYRQGQDQDWKLVFDRVVADLRERVK